MCIRDSSNTFCQKYILVLDAGHGGKDPGAVYGNIQEKDITLSLVLEVGNILSNTYENIKVIYTRQSDIFIPLIERTRIANKSHANLFVSFHVNASKSIEANGYEVFVMGNTKVKAWLETAIAENSVAIYEENYLESYDGIDPNSIEGYIAFSLYQNQFLNKSISLADKVTNSTLQIAPFTNRGIKPVSYTHLMNQLNADVVDYQGLKAQTIPPLCPNCQSKNTVSYTHLSLFLTAEFMASDKRSFI